MSLRILRTIKRFIPHLISFVGFRRTPPTRRTRKRRCQTKTNSYRYDALIVNGDRVYWGPASALHHRLFHYRRHHDPPDEIDTPRAVSPMPDNGKVAEE